MKAQCRSFLLLFLLLLSGTAGAQERFQDRLPENTLAYVASANREALESVRATNPLLRLLASPEMKANWEALRTSRSRRTGQQAKESAAKEDEEFLELLKAPGLIALLPPDPHAPPRATGGPQPLFLFLLDTLGQEALIERLRSRAVIGGGAFSSYDFEGVVVEEARNPAGEATGYLARLDRWLVGGSERAATENWIRAVREAPARSLKDTESYSTARAMLTAPAQWEAYLNLPALVDLFSAVPSLGASAPPPEKIVAALGLRAFGPFLAAVEFRPETTRYQLMLARREPAASPLDALAPAAPQFASLSLGGADALGYSVTRVDFQAGWSYLQGAAASLFPPAALFVLMADSFLEEKTGFTLPQFISATGDEFAHFEYAGETDNPLQTVWALRHRDRARVLALVEGALPAMVQRFGFHEVAPVGGQDGIPAYYRLEPKPETDPAAAAKEVRTLLYLAVTDDWVLVTSTESVLQRTLARVADSPSLAEADVFRRARSRFPAELSTFGFMDVDAWLASGVIERWLEQAAAAQQSKPADDGEAGAAPAEPPPTPLKLNIPRGYLKWIVTGTTQDARGIYHSGYIE